MYINTYGKLIYNRNNMFEHFAFVGEPFFDLFKKYPKTVGFCLRRVICEKLI